MDGKVATMHRDPWAHLTLLMSEAAREVVVMHKPSRASEKGTFDASCRGTSLSAVRAIGQTQDICRCATSAVLQGGASPEAFYSQAPGKKRKDYAVKRD